MQIKRFKILTKCFFPLQDFYHSYYDNHQTIWSLESIPKLVDFTYSIEDKEKYRVVNEVIDVYKRDILPLYPEFQKGHNFNVLNISFAFFNRFLNSLKLLFTLFGK